MEWNVYRSLRFSLWILLTGVLLGGCSQSPEETVKRYLDYTYKGNDGRRAFRLLSADDQKYTTEKDFIREIKRKNVFNEKFLKKYKDHFTYEILETQFVNEDTVKIKVALTKPNTGNLVQEMLTLAMATSITRLSGDERKALVENHFGKFLKAEEASLETEEKEYILVRENGEYKIFLNLGYPYKMELLNNKINKLRKEAEENIRKADYQKALKIYRSILTLKPSDEARSNIAELEEILNKTVSLNQEIKTGNISVRPTKIEMKNIRIARRNWLEDTPKESLSPEKYLVLTLEVHNLCEGEVIEVFENHRYKRKHVVYDNFGNEMREFLLDFDMLYVENNQVRKVSPGEVRTIKAICEAPLSAKSDKFVWKMRVFNDNKKTEDFIYVAFGRKDIVVAEEEPGH